MTWRTKLRAELKRAGYTLAAVGDVLGVSESAVGHYLSGRREPSIKALKTMTELAGMSLDDLFGKEAKYLVVEPQEIAVVEALRAIPASQQALALKLLKSLSVENTEPPPASPARPS